MRASSSLGLHKEGFAKRGVKHEEWLRNSTYLVSDDNTESKPADKVASVTDLLLIKMSTWSLE